MKKLMKGPFWILALFLCVTSCGGENNTASGTSQVDSGQTPIPAETEDVGFVVTANTRLRANQADITAYMRNTIPSKKTFRLDSQTATIKLALYKAWAQLIAGGNIDWSTANYGYLMHFDSLYNYMDSIKLANDKLRSEGNESLVIDGIRIYPGAVQLSSGLCPDVFLYPTINKKNIDSIDEHYNIVKENFEKSIGGDQEEFIRYLGGELMKLSAEGGNGYNSSLPCPQTCP